MTMVGYDEYGVTERGEVRHIVRSEPQSWCGRELIWLYPNPDSPGCPTRICARCRRVQARQVESQT